MTGTTLEHEYLTVHELAALLRLKERKVYDLAASGEVPVYRATGKLLFPAAEIRAWIERSRSGAAAAPGASDSRAASPARPPIVLGSHDPLLDWAIRESRCGLASYYDGSLDGLDRFVAGEGVAAGLHVRDAATSSWNVTTVAAVAGSLNAVLVHFARRRRGLVYRKGDPTPAGLPAIEGRRVVPRQPGSGTERLFEALAADEGLELDRVTFTDIARTEDEAVESVRRGEADVAFGLESVARAYALEFLPLIEEEFALLIDRRAWFEPALQRLLACFADERFRRRAADHGGYDVGGIGAVLWNA